MKKKLLFVTLLFCLCTIVIAFNPDRMFILKRQIGGHQHDDVGIQFIRDHIDILERYFWSGKKVNKTMLKGVIGSPDNNAESDVWIWCENPSFLEEINVIISSGLYENKEVKGKFMMLDYDHRAGHYAFVKFRDNIAMSIDPPR